MSSLAYQPRIVSVSKFLKKRSMRKSIIIIQHINLHSKRKKEYGTLGITHNFRMVLRLPKKQKIFGQQYTLVSISKKHDHRMVCRMRKNPDLA